MIVLYIILTGSFLGTFGLAWSHHIVHKYGLFGISIVWIHHLKHHKKDDPEQKLKRTNHMAGYAAKRTVKYLNIKNWQPLDFAVGLLGLVIPPLGLSFIVGLYVAECIGYLQHTYNGHPIDFTCKFDNYIGLNCGKHSKHHNKKIKYKVKTPVLLGIVCANFWVLVCLSLYPLLLINKKRATIPGAYLYGFWQNAANYKALYGNSITNLLYRASSIFDNPYILLQYFRIMFTGKGDHDISDIRNIYNFIKEKGNSTVVRYQGQIIEGRHRVAAGYKRLIFIDVKEV